MNEPSIRTVVHIVLYTLIVTKVCGAKRKLQLQVTPSIHSTVVTEEHWTSSCAVIEEGVPVCQDPVEDVEPIDDVNLSKTRTPYPDSGFVLRLLNSGRGRRPRSTTGRTWQWLWRQWRDYEDSDSVQQDNRVEVLEEDDLDHQELLEPTSVDYYDADAVPKTVITYMIKGCSPSKVPNDLTPCSVARDDDEFLQQGSADRITSTRVIHYLPPSAAPAKSSDDDYDGYWPCIFYISC